MIQVKNTGLRLEVVRDPVWYACSYCPLSKMVRDRSYPDRRSADCMEDVVKQVGPCGGHGLVDVDARPEGAEPT